MPFLTRQPFRRILSILIIFSILAPRAEGNDLSTSLRINTDFNPEGFAGALDFSFRAPLAEGELHLDFPNPLSCSFPEARSWAVRIIPCEPISLYAGAIAIHGLPARAANPVPYVFSPFHIGVRTESARILEPGTARSTGTIGIEAGVSGSHRIAACFSHPSLELSGAHESAPGAWMLYRFSPGEPRGIRRRFALSTFAGIRNPDSTEPDSWFSANPEDPGTPLHFSALETEFVTSPLRARLSFFGNTGPCRETTGAISGEATLAVGRLSVSAGGFTAGDGFLGLTGDKPAVSSRFFLAPLLILPFSSRSPFNFRWGAIVHADIQDGDAWYDAEYLEFEGGTGISLVTANASTTVKAMYSEQRWKISASRRHSRYPAASLITETGGFIELMPEKQAFPSPAGTGATAEVGWKPCAFFSLAADCSIKTACIADPGPSLSSEYGISASTRIRSSFPELRVTGKLSLKLPIPSGEGSLTIDLTLP